MQQGVSNYIPRQMSRSFGRNTIFKDIECADGMILVARASRRLLEFRCYAITAGKMPAPPEVTQPQRLLRCLFCASPGGRSRAGRERAPALIHRPARILACSTHRVL